MLPNGPPRHTSDVARTLKTAHELLAAGRIDEADQLSQSLLAVTASVPVQLLACAVAEARTDLPQAFALVTEALAHHGENAELLLKKAQVLMQLRRRHEGVDAARRAAEICPTDARLLQAIAEVHIDRNEPAEAKPLLQRARELLPADPAILYYSAMSHFNLGEMNEAATFLEQLLTIDPGNGFALYVRSQLDTQTAASNHIEQLRSTLLRQGIRKQDAVSTYFALAKELEDIGEFSESFAVLSEGNRIKRGTLDYRVQTDLDAMQNLMAHYSREALERAAPGDPATGPIFVVSMPGTDTSLVERMFGHAADVISLGELADFPIEVGALARQVHQQSGSTDPDLLRASLQLNFAELGRNYLQAVRPLAGGRKHFIDTLPSNFRYCGLIHQALPNAKIVHLTRNALDTCYTVFKTPFVNAYHFSYQLDEVAQFYVGYRRTMEHWHAVMPGVIYDLSYEDLIADPPAQCRRLLDFCGLPWQDEVLGFHHSAVTQWRHFEQQLQPVVRRLAAAGLVDLAGNALPKPASS